MDDHPLFRRGLAVALEAQTDLRVIGEAGNASDALAIAERETVDIAVLDVLMPTVSGLSLASELHERHPTCRVLALSVIDEAGLIADMFSAHAHGFAVKTQPIGEIIEAVGQVLAGVRYLPPHLTWASVEAELATSRGQPLKSLTRREREVFELLIRGNTNDEVAQRLCIARRTVETHRQRIMNKLSAHSIAQMQRIAARHGGLLT